MVTNDFAQYAICNMQYANYKIKIKINKIKIKFIKKKYNMYLLNIYNL